MNIKRSGSIAAIALVGVLALASCAANEGGSTDTPAASDLSGTLNGAGSSSQGAAQDAWIAAFQTANPDVTVNYDPPGSGAGRDTFIAGGADFAGSDAALNDDELAGDFASCARRRPRPSTCRVYISPIAVIFNVDGVDELNLDAATIAGIFTGTITTWNDPAIAAAERRRHAPRRDHHRRAPLRRLGHHPELHRLPRARSLRRLDLRAGRRVPVPGR